MIDKKLEELLKKSVTQTLQEKNVLGKYSKVNESTKNNKALFLV